MVVVALLSVDLVESVDLVVNCIGMFQFTSPVISLIEPWAQMVTEG